MKEDWRTKASITVTKDVPPENGLDEIKKGDILKALSIIPLTKNKSLSFTTPSLTALYISSAEKNWLEYRKFRKNSKIDRSIKKKVFFENDTELFDALELLLLSIISSYTAIESFCNESIPEDYDYWHHRKSKTIVEKSNKKEIERHFSTSSKLVEILPTIYHVKNPKGTRAWESYVKLKRCRDSLIHAKSNEVRYTIDGENHIWEKLLKIEKPYLLAKEIFKWYLAKHDSKPSWFKNYPK